jgi:hypothetical protein
MSSFTPREPPATEKIKSLEQVVEFWLTELRFHPFLSAEYEYCGPLSDPKRNGIFLAELVGYLHPQNLQARSLTNTAIIS